MPRNTSVTLGSHFDGFVEAKIKEGRFGSVSEVVRAGLRLLEEQENRLARLRSELEKGEQSPIVDDFSIDALIEELDQERRSKAE